MSCSGFSKGTRYQKLLRINSADRIQNSSSSDSNFSINLNDNLKKVKAISISSVRFYNNMYNVYSDSQKFNNVFYANTTFGPLHIPITITPGYYTASQLAAAIHTAVSAGFIENFNFTWNPNRNHYFIQGDATVPNVTVTTPAQGQIDSRIVTGSPMTLLGFNSGFSVPQSTGSPAEANEAPYMVRTNMAYIQSSAIAPSNQFDEEGKTWNSLIGVPIDVPFRSVVKWDCKQDILCAQDFGLPRDITSIDIQLVDHDGYPLDLDGSPLNLEFKVWYDAY